MKSEANAVGKGDRRETAKYNGGGGAAYAIKGAIDEMDQISKTAQKIGTTTSAFGVAVRSEACPTFQANCRSAMTRLSARTGGGGAGTERYVDLFWRDRRLRRSTRTGRCAIPLT